MQSTSLCRIITFSLIVGMLFFSTGIGQHDADALWGWVKKRLACWRDSAACAAASAGAVAICTNPGLSGWSCAQAVASAVAACLKAADTCS